jgi:hypothetical protein
MNYNPSPVDTSCVRLSDEIEALKESLARNAHDVWARQRLDQGWTYGLNRNDDAKTHPCLIPYEELPESEKEYDRKTAIETLRMIIALGYQIKRV